MNGFGMDESSMPGWGDGILQPNTVDRGFASIDGSCLCFEVSTDLVADNDTVRPIDRYREARCASPLSRVFSKVLLRFLVVATTIVLVSCAPSAERGPLFRKWGFTLTKQNSRYKRWTDYKNLTTRFQAVLANYGIAAHSKNMMDEFGEWVSDNSELLLPSYRLNNLTYDDYSERFQTFGYTMYPTDFPEGSVDTALIIEQTCGYAPNWIDSTFRSDYAQMGIGANIFNGRYCLLFDEDLAYGLVALGFAIQYPAWILSVILHEIAHIRYGYNLHSGHSGTCCLGNGWIGLLTQCDSNYNQYSIYNLNRLIFCNYHPLW